MEEDIKNLEKYIDLVLNKNYCECNELNVICHGPHCDGSKNVAVSIEKLIKGYRELEKENRIFALAGSNIALKLHIEENYIPKSKIKEKIEEIEESKEYAYRDEEIMFKKTIQVLQELMEDK